MKGSPIQIKIPGTAVPPSLPCPALSISQRALLWKHFTLVNKHPEITALMFYRNLFTLDPALQALFHTGMELQAWKLMEALEFAIATLPNPAELVPVLETLGRRHVICGASAAHYTILMTAIMQTLRGMLGAEFTPEAENSWRAVLGFIHDAMLQGVRRMRQLLNN
ncbi:MAG: hemin receptor [Verrucomicrobiales bacterium]|nr:hemin receptor [Verrucomicrobiales bacterium]